MKKLITNNLGFPRIGENRELKRATESYWRGDIGKSDLLRAAGEIKKNNWMTQAESGIDLIPSNDFSLYDHVLDTACMTGAVPERFGREWGGMDLDLYFRMARGIQEKETGGTHARAEAMEMTKWFDTNYHYIVPEFHAGQKFKRAYDKPVTDFREALGIGIKTKPVLLGPVSFLMSGKSGDSAFVPLTLLEELLPVYIDVLRDLSASGAGWIQIDEPVTALDLGRYELRALEEAYRGIMSELPGLNLLLTSYFGRLGTNVGTVLKLPVAGFHFDLVRGREDAGVILDLFPDGPAVSLGLVNGRGIWRNDLSDSSAVIGRFVSKLGEERVMVAPSCSLIHVPVSLRKETNMGGDVKRIMAFAEEKLDEVFTLSSAHQKGVFDKALLENKRLFEGWSKNPGIDVRNVKEAAVGEYSSTGTEKRAPFAVRQAKQRKAFNLPLFPTTTIGSFPQTQEVRSRRQRVRKAEITEEEYGEFIREEIAEVIRLQEEIGLDVLVHGEFERSDMVEFFGEKLNGFALTGNGWVQSYGSRYVKPPIIYGDVSRQGPMTVELIRYAASLTDKPVKGMLTGPVTILQWSFCREDIRRPEIAKQIAFALRDEVRDLERAGIGIIQIDEPALREGLPLRKEDWEDYLKWAVEAFHISSSVLADETQIHTHMCYSDFNDIIESISALDADVISIETSRSHMELLDAFRDFKYPNEIGPGVYDIHSPLVPSVRQIEELVLKAADYIPRENLWINPDCGLKTRSSAEVSAALKNMVEAAGNLRRRFTE